jgi:hypothetical protein
LHRADARHLLKASATRESRRDWRESILAWLGQLGFGRLLARNTCRLLEPLNIASAVNAAAWLRSSSRAVSRLTEQKVT